MKLAWSRLARAELKELRRFSTERWGCEVAQRYLEDLRDAAKRLSAAPLTSRPLRGNLRIFRVRSHYLVLHVDAAADRITVTRMLHVARDVEQHLP